MPITGLNSRTLTDFQGADQLSDAFTRRGAILSKNVEYVLNSRGQAMVQTRRGIAQLWDPNEAIRSMMHWIQADWDRLVYFIPDAAAGGSVKSRNFDLGTTDVLLNELLGTDAVGARFAAYGSRVIIAAFNNNAEGSDQGRVWNGLSDGGGPQVDKLFQGPLVETTDFAFGLTEPLSGVVSAGDHRVGFVARTRNAFEGKPTIAAATFTAAGGQHLRIILTPVGNGPAWIESVRVVMTTVNNPSLYFFIPDSRTTVAAGTNFAVTIDVDLDDVSMSQGAEATDQFDLFTQTGAGVGPFDPFFVLAYGTRMVYMATFIDTEVLANATSIFISDPGRPQVITAEFHQRQLPGKRQAVCAFVLQNTLYILGPQGTFAYDDNTGKPVTWAAPTEIDNRIGTTSPYGASTDTAHTRAWVASPQGLYPFKGGFYPDIPTSHLQATDWARINWAAAPAGAVQVIDDADEQTVRVLAPLDGATLPTHVLSWNYTWGDSWEAAGLHYTIDDYGPLTNPGALASIINPTKKVSEYIISNAAAGKVYRQKSVQAADGTSLDDSALYSDDSLAIDSAYRSRALPTVHPVKIQHGGDHIRLVGNGRTKLSVYDFDQKRRLILSDVEHSQAAPGGLIEREYDVRSEAVHLEVGNNNRVGSWWRLTAIKHYFKDWITKQ